MTVFVEVELADSARGQIEPFNIAKTFSLPQDVSVNLFFCNDFHRYLNENVLVKIQFCDGGLRIR